MDFGSCMKRIGTKVGKIANLGKISEAVPVHPSRSQPVPVQVRAVPVQVCPKCPDCVVFAY